MGGINKTKHKLILKVFGVYAPSDIIKQIEAFAQTWLTLSFEHWLQSVLINKSICLETGAPDIFRLSLLSSKLTAKVCDAMAEFLNNLRNRKVYSVRRDVDERDWKVLYRFERENVEWMSEHFLGHSEERRGGALTPLQRLKIFLRYVADPGFQTGVATDIGVRQPTVSNVITEIIPRIMQKSNYWIHFPSTDEEFEREKAAWQESYNFPCAIGAIDCTHIPILKPAVHGDEYINRKGFPSLNVLATCNSSEMFTSVDVSWPGSVHDARIWTNSEIQPVIRRNQVRAVLLGDAGFGVAPWLMTPFRTPGNPVQQAFNNMLTRERVIIERCFGQVKQRFPILKHKIRLAIEKVPQIIACCFILHNVAKYLKDDDFPLEENREGNVEGLQIEDENIRIRERGNIRRVDIANVIYQMNQQ